MAKVRIERSLLCLLLACGGDAGRTEPDDGGLDGLEVGGITGEDAASSEAEDEGTASETSTGPSTGSSSTSESTGTGDDDTTTTSTTGSEDESSSSSTTTGDTGDGDGDGDGDDEDRCNDPLLQWSTGHKTWYESYPDPGSDECVIFNGCQWSGWFAGCSGQQPEWWVQETNIAAVFPGFESLAHHEICIRSGTQTMIVNVIDTCSDSDCGGCCSQNLGGASALVDLEWNTNERWGLPDGPLEWADLGERPDHICD